MPQDILRHLGALALASRLKRLADRLQRDVSRVYRDQAITFRSRWFPVAYLLSRSSPHSVTEIAQALGLTHVAVNQIAGEMTRSGLLTSRRDKNDERRRLLALSGKGRRTVTSLQPLWQSIRRCTTDVIASSGHDVLAALSAIESSLDESEMYERISRTLKEKPKQRRSKR